MTHLLTKRIVLLANATNKVFKGGYFLSNGEAFLPHLEWEFMNKPISITSVSEHENLPKGQKKIVIDRDEEYSLRAVLYFEDTDYIFARKSADAPGSYVETFEITGSDDSKSQFYTLGSSYIGSMGSRMDNVENKFSGTAELGFNGLKIKTNNKNEVMHLTEWCLSGPKDPVFSRATHRKVSKAFIRERLESKDDKFDFAEISRESSSYSVDFLMIKTGDLQFVIGKVPHQIGPNWSTNIGIDYRTIWGGIPDIAKREKVLELCSFVFGRQLLSIGHTLYDKEEKVIEAYARDPWGKSAKSHCAEPDAAPISICLSQRGRAEAIISQLLPKYFKLCEALCLKEALWNYWVSREMPLGANLPILAAGVESMINGWFRQNKSNSNGLFMDKDKFVTLLTEELESIGKKLKEVPNGDKIAAKMLKANEFGIMERYRRFFGEIMLPVNEKEWKAIEARNIFVHGEALFDKTDWQEIAQRKRTFETLFNKIFLKLLEYSGTFTDYSAIGWPETPLVLKSAT